MKPELMTPDWPAPEPVIALSTTRRGGCSQAPFDTLNLGDHVGDVPESVAANRASLLESIPGLSRVSWLDQVHGTAVVPAGSTGPAERADAQWTREPGMGCAILTADCLPVLFSTVSGDVVAAAHAGWRGLQGGVLEATVAAMGAEPGGILAWLGPAIGPAAFEVGVEVRDAFSDACSNSRQVAQVQACFVPSARGDSKYLADLYMLARLRLANIGVVQVYGGDRCTLSDGARFFSYRRDGVTGRMASIIGIRIS